MSEEPIPFSKPYFTSEDIEEINARIDKVLRSGWLTSGPLVEEFEKTFAEFVGTKYGVALNSCTAALHATLLALGIKSGDEVIVPSDTFVATANAVLYVGAKPVFADSDSKSFNVSPVDIEEKISDRTKAIIVVHLAGNPCDMKEISRIVEDHKLMLVEDCAHAHGAKYRNTNCGVLGEVGCFSFYPTKVMTCAEGGMVTTNNEALAEKVRIIRNHGRAGYGPNENTEIGFNFRLSDVHAAVGLSQLRHARDFVFERNRVAERYDQEIRKIDWIRPQDVEDGNLCSYYAYIVKLEEDSPVNRDEAMEILRNKGIGTSVLYHPIHLQPLYTRLFGYRKGILPVAEELGERSLALPLFNGMKDEQVDRIIDIVRELVDKE